MSSNHPNKWVNWWVSRKTRNEYRMKSQWVNHIGAATGCWAAVIRSNVRSQRSLFYLYGFFSFSLLVFVFRESSSKHTYHNHIYRWIPLVGLKKRAHIITHSHMVRDSCMRFMRYSMSCIRLCDCGGVAAAHTHTPHPTKHSNRMWSAPWMHVGRFPL